MYTPGGVAVAIRGVGGRWGSRCGRFRCGPTVSAAPAPCAAATAARSTAVPSPRQPRSQPCCITRAAVMAVRRPLGCRRRSPYPTDLTAAVRLSQALPRYRDATPAKTPPVETPPPKVQTNLSDQSVQPCFQFSPHRISVTRRLVLSLNAINEQPQRLAQKLQCPHLCAVGIAITQCDASSFSTTRSARESRCMRCSRSLSAHICSSLWETLGCCASKHASRCIAPALMFCASYAVRYASLKLLPANTASTNACCLSVMPRFGR
jgi:hypothetical protein